VHLALFPAADEIAAEDTALLADWQKLLLVRDEALKSLEEARKEKRIGKALEAKVQVEASADLAAVLNRYQSSLKELFNVSQVEVVTGAGETILATTLPADGTKCERCWNFMPDVATFGPWPKVCGRCAAALEQMGYSREPQEVKA
jgi:isoleucyl-tRNA synthetase